MEQIVLKRKDKVKPKNPLLYSKTWDKGVIIKFSMDEDEALVLTNDNRTIWAFVDTLEKIE